LHELIHSSRLHIPAKVCLQDVRRNALQGANSLKSKNRHTNRSTECLWETSHAAVTWVS
jgi:hypothetical protein